MKIPEIKNQNFSKKIAKKSKTEQSGSFFSLLEGQLNPLEESSPTASSSEIVADTQIPSQLRLAGVSLSENAINLLESYSKALDNLDLKADDLAPLIEAIEGDTTALLDIKEQIPETDPLAQLIDRVTTITYLEAEKFRRGDYHN